MTGEQYGPLRSGGLRMLRNGNPLWPGGFTRPEGLQHIPAGGQDSVPFPDRPADHQKARPPEWFREAHQYRRTAQPCPKALWITRSPADMSNENP